MHEIHLESDFGSGTFANEEERWWIPSRLGWWLQRDPGAGNNKSRMRNRLLDVWHGRKNRVRAKILARAAVWGLALILIVWLCVKWYGWSSGYFVSHSDTGVTEFIPVSGCMLGMHQIGMLKQMTPYRNLLSEEFKVGHAHVSIPNPGQYAGSAMDQTYSAEARQKTWLPHQNDATVDIQKLNVALREHCEYTQCECTAAPHLGVPLRVVYTPSTGTMLNPSLVYTGRRVEGGQYKSVLADYSGSLPIEARVEYVSSWDKHGHPRLSRASLVGAEAACVFVTIEAEFDLPPPPSGHGEL